MEVLAAASLLRELCPELRVRVVNVTDLMILSPHGEHPHGLSDVAFNSLFTRDKPIHFNYVCFAMMWYRINTDFAPLALLSHRIEGAFIWPP